MKNKMKYKLVIADVDGTLFPPSEVISPAPPKRLADAVERARQKGAEFTIASGRSLIWIEEIIKGLDLKVPLILDNGARIYDPVKKSYVWESLVKEETAKKVLEILSKDKSLRIIVSDDGNRFENIEQINKWKISKILVLGITPGKAKRLHDELRNIPNISVTRSISGTGKKSQSVHVTDADATKQVAAGKLMEFLGIRKEEIIGIGDSYNDFPLLMASGLKVAMANAVPELKEIADYIAPPYYEHGVVDVIEKYILKKD